MSCNISCNISAKSSRTLLITVLMVLLMEPSVCSNPDCKPGNLPLTDLYALEVKDEYSTFRAKVYYNACAEIETAGPNWYRVDVVGPAKNLGYFRVPEPGRRAGVVLVDEGLEFTAGDEPLVLWDLPRKFTWEAYNPYEPPSKPCFRLTVQHGGVCEQTLSDISNCPAFEEEEEEEGSATDDGTMQENEIIAYYTILEEDEDEELVTSCHNKFDCTGRRYNPACGSNGRWYANTCILRLEKCLNKNSFQRDTTELSCRNSTTPTPPTPTPPVPTVASASPTPPTPATPLYLSQPCFQYLESLENSENLSEDFFFPKCDIYGQFRPVQCFQQDEEVICLCYSILGAPYGGWTADCSTIPPPNRCGV